MAEWFSAPTDDLRDAANAADWISQACRSAMSGSQHRSDVVARRMQRLNELLLPHVKEQTDAS